MVVYIVTIPLNGRKSNARQRTFAIPPTLCYTDGVVILILALFPLRPVSRAIESISLGHSAVRSRGFSTVIDRNHDLTTGGVASVSVHRTGDSFR